MAELAHRENNFDGIRLLSASMVIVTHAYDLTGHWDREWVTVLTQGQASTGGLAVNLFFTLSGYLVAQSLERSPTLWSFFAKRFLRIYPALISAVLLSWLVAGPLGGANWGQVASAAPSSLKVLVGGGSPTMAGFCDGNVQAGNLNGSLWTVRFEMLCYVGLAVGSVLGLRNWKAGWVLTLFLCYAGSRVNHRFGFLPGLGGGLVEFFVPYLVGTVTYQNRAVLLNGRWWPAAVCGAAVLLGAVLHCFWWVAPICAGYLAIWLGFLKPFPLQVVGRIGDFSYGMYVYAFPIQQLLAHFYGDRWPVGVHMAVTWLLALVVAVPSWFWLEKPMLRLKRRVQKAGPIYRGDPVASATPV